MLPLSHDHIAPDLQLQLPPPEPSQVSGGTPPLAAHHATIPVSTARPQMPPRSHPTATPAAGIISPVPHHRDTSCSDHTYQDTRPERHPTPRSSHTRSGVRLLLPWRAVSAPLHSTRAACQADPAAPMPPSPLHMYIATYTHPRNPPEKLQISCTTTPTQSPQFLQPRGRPIRPRSLMNT